MITPEYPETNTLLVYIMWLVSFTVVEYILVILHTIGKSHVKNVIRSGYMVVCHISDFCCDHDKCHIVLRKCRTYVNFSTWRHDKQ